MTTSTADTTRTVDADRLAAPLAIATVALLPLATGWVLWSAEGGAGDFNQRVSTSPFDWPLALLIVLQVARLAEDRVDLVAAIRRSAPVVRLAAVTAAWLAVCALVTPSWRAVDLAFHLAGVWALVVTARRATASERTALLVALTVLGALQALLGIAQSRAGEALGLGLLEFDGPLYTFGDVSAGRGSLTHPYHLTALLVVCLAAGAVLWTRVGEPAARTATGLAVAAMGVGIPLTFSRAVALALVPMLVLWAWRPGTRTIVPVVVGAIVVGLLLGSSGVSAKAARTVDVDAADSGRIARLEEAVDLMADDPVAGVGPGRYVIAVRDVKDDDLLPPHNLVAQAGAEAGVPGFVLTAALLAAFGWWLLRRDPLVMAAGASLLPFHLLDSYPHVFPVGITISGLWLAVVVVADEQTAHDRSVST